MTKIQNYDNQYTFLMTADGLKMRLTYNSGFPKILSKIICDSKRIETSIGLPAVINDWSTQK